MCIAHYVVGVGDRHLNNTLIDKTTGNCIGIDFGHAFGTATKVSFIYVKYTLILRSTGRLNFSKSELIREYTLKTDGYLVWTLTILTSFTHFKKN